MSDKVRDAAMIDVVFGYCAKHDIDPNSLHKESFGSMIARFYEFMKTDSLWVLASQQIRHAHPICHSDCHIKNIQDYMEKELAKDSKPGLSLVVDNSKSIH